MSLTPEEASMLADLQSRSQDTSDAGEVAEAVALAVSCVASDVAHAVDSGESRELYAAQERADRADRRVSELEAQVQEANDRLAAMAEVTIVAGALESVSEPEPQVVEVPAPVVDPPVTEVVDDTQTAPEVTGEEPPAPKRKRSSLYGKR